MNVVARPRLSRWIMAVLALALMATACISDASGPSAAADPSGVSNDEASDLNDDGGDATTESNQDEVETSNNVGASTLNDRFVASFGNGGYDVRSYELQLDWFPETASLEGVTTIRALATQDLSTFNLDLVGFDVTSVQVDGEDADLERSGPELAITPEVPIENEASFVVTLAYNGQPQDDGILNFTPGAASGWHIYEDYVAVFGEPISAATFHPVNDHPSDKASFRYVISAPNDDVVAASGTLESSTTVGDRTTWIFNAPAPQATYLTTILIGPFDVIEAGESTSGVPIRNVIDSDVLERSVDALEPQAAMIDAFEELFGPYPFDVYGSAVIEDGFGGALETQTLSIFGADIMGLGAVTESVVAHELAHQWFGNNVSVQSWGDLWLNEGFATYAEFLWLEARDGSFDYDSWVQSNGFQSFGLEDPIQPPPLDDLFGGVYQRGALTLHALRVEVGDEAFFETLRTWNVRFGGQSAGSADFEALAEEISGQDLGDLFDAWLRQDGLPDRLGDIALRPATEDDQRAAIDAISACMAAQGAPIDVDSAAEDLAGEASRMFEAVFAYGDEIAFNCADLFSAFG